MAKFVRDEKRTYPFVWLLAGGLFAGSAVWATYAEFVTRVPWQRYQDAYFSMELEQSRQLLERAKQEWSQEIEPGLKDKLDRKAEIEQSMATGDYKTASDRLAQLNKEFADAEVGKTFGGSDLDEAYYYRNLAEYDRDAAAQKVRDAFRAAYAAEDPAKGVELGDAIYRDPPRPPRREGATDRMYHLDSEIARMTGHVAQIDAAMSAQTTPAPALKLLRESRQGELEVVDRLKVEVTHQGRVDTAVAKMTAIDGPTEPPLSEKDPVKREEERKRERARVCAAADVAETRNCIQWLKLDPVNAELKAIEIEVTKRRRSLSEGELRNTNADAKANPKFDPGNLIQSLVGPFQIQQVVLHWIEYDREVDMEQVDRCHTCHMGTDNGNYTSAAIPRTFRTHPMRNELLSKHPIDQFGCISCHQGQGRATDMLSHSAWVLEEHHGKERWHYKGDHYWEDPMLPIGKLERIVVDDRNDELAVKIHKAKWETIKIDHKNPSANAKDPEVPASYATEAELFGALQEKLAKVVEANDDVKAKWHAVVRKTDNRVEIGLEPNDPAAHIPAKEIPGFGVRFADHELSDMFGFGGAAEIVAKTPRVVAEEPPALPIRSNGMAERAKDGKYTAPRGDLGLQVPDESRNQFIQALPEVEAGCLKCHSADVDLKPRGSHAKFVAAKLDYEKAEAHRKKDLEGYKKAHDGSDDLPAVPPEPSALKNLAPTFSEGRATFRQLNCTGCHILEGFPWDRNAGPALDNLTAKVGPDWVLTWLRDPRGWRAKTSMPNLWPKPLDPASKRPLPPGTPEYDKWEKQMRDETLAVASFLVERSENPSIRPGAPKDAKALRNEVAGYADVPGASIEKGKVAFEAYGCQGCHARVEGDTDAEKLTDPWRSRERDVAPTLANMGSKTSADWIAYWVENPSRYWHGTKMPDLRLTRIEAASVGLYLASMKSAPANPAHVDPADIAIVRESAKRAEKVPCSAANGQLMTRVECGERLVGYYGCFGCHQISGFEKSAPVAPELGGFAKKDVTTLDFGYALADHHLHTTETFATIKIDSPRIYRRDRIELKMGDFDASPREIRALTVFLKGLVNFKPKSSYTPAANPAYNAALEGRQLVEDLNCRGCHVIEGSGGDIDSLRQAQLSADAQQRAPFLNGEGARVQPEWLFTFLKAPGANGIRPWLHPEWAFGDVPDDKKALRMPTFTLSNEQVTAIVRYFASWDGQEYPYQVPKANDLTEDQRLYTLTHMIAADAANCMSCHFQGAFPVERGQTELAKLAPDLNNVARRLRPDWVKSWILRPQNYLPYTKMTAFIATVNREKDNPFWPSEADPFRSPPLAWNKTPNPPQVTGEQQAEMIRDFLFGLPGDAVFPAPGSEADSPLVKRPGAEQPRTEAADEDAEPKPKKRRTGSLAPRTPPPG